MQVVPITRAVGDWTWRTPLAAQPGVMMCFASAAGTKVGLRPGGQAGVHLGRPGTQSMSDASGVYSKPCASATGL
jgi:hypothetical protein